MPMFLFLIYLLNPQELGYLDQADALRAERKYFSAETLYLSQEPELEDIERVGLALCDISLRMGNLERREGIYQGYLTRSQQWRGVASLALANLAIHRRDYEAFSNYAGIYLREYPSQHTVRMRLLYYLARYSAESAEDMGLSLREQTWFDACRKMSDQQNWPQLDESSGLDPKWRLRYGLEAALGSTLPEEDASFDDEDRYILKLLHVRQALNEKNEAEAARLINQVAALDEQLNRPELTIHYYPMMAEFFTARGEADRAKRTLGYLQRMQDWAVFPMLLDAEHLAKQESALDPQPEEEPVADKEEPKPEEDEPVEVVETSKPEAEPVIDYETLEGWLLQGRRGLELKIRKLEITTQYQKIYRNYLLGLHYLLAKRYTEAGDRLRVAKAQVESLPFPSLEVKIMLALADVEDQTDESKANWYRLQAMQIWAAPQHLPVFAAATKQPPSPTAKLLDRALTGTGTPEMAHELILYSETARYKDLLRRAYKRQVLSTNPVLGNQISLIGGQLAQHVTTLATNPDHAPNPRRYNDTLEIWNQLWRSTRPYYQQSGTPSVRSLQRALGVRDRLISFVEGNQKLGVLLISRDQAFALPLGNKHTFQRLNTDEQMGFLVGRLGTIWETDGTLFLAVSDIFRDGGILEALAAKMADRNRLRTIFSLKSFLSPKQRHACNSLAYFGNDPLPFSIEAGLRMETFPLDGVTRLDFETRLENHGHVVYAGPLSLKDQGLAFGSGGESMYFHEMVHYNPGLCSLTLLAQETPQWGVLLDELELIDPTSAMSINLMNAASQIGELRLGDGGLGARFP